MTRVWLLLFTLSLSVAFLLHRPSGTVSIPVPVWLEIGGEKVLVDKIPADVFWYHIFEHAIAIINAGIMLSLILWPTDRQQISAYVLIILIHVMDAILFRIYYRDWGFVIPWNVIKTTIFGLNTFRLQWKQLLQYR